MSVSNEELMKFNDGIADCTKRIGGGKVAIDSTCVRALVCLHKEAAYRYVELHCMMAQSQPGYLQSALVIAGAYQVEFNDAQLMKMVHDKSIEVKADFSQIRYANDIESLSQEPQERNAARAWWKKNERDDASCDNCNNPLKRGEGYLINGRMAMLGDRRLDLGEELVCEKCFENITHGVE